MAAVEDKDGLWLAQPAEPADPADPDGSVEQGGGQRWRLVPTDATAVWRRFTTLLPAADPTRG